MGEDVPQENLAASEVNLSDEAVLVASDIEHRVLTYLIGGLKGPLEISKHRPIRFFRHTEPIIEATLSFRVNRPKCSQFLFGDDVHDGSFSQNDIYFFSSLLYPLFKYYEIILIQKSKVLAIYCFPRTDNQY